MSTKPSDRQCRLAVLTCGLIALLAAMIPAGAAVAQIMPVPMIGPPPMPDSPANGQDRQINLPYAASDGIGGMWYIYADGALRQQMGQPIYSQGGLLNIRGARFDAANNQGTLDGKTGELILSNNINGLNVTRRIFFDKKDHYVRYVDVIHNPTTQNRDLTLNIQTILNWGVQQDQVIQDSKHKNADLGWVATTGIGRTVLEVYGGVGGKVAPTIIHQNGSNVVEARYSIKAPAGQTVAIMHLHLFVSNLDAGKKFVSDLASARLAQNLPGDLQGCIVNFEIGQQWLQDLDILRGDVFDVVELRGGDRFNGTLTETDYKLQTFYGPVDLPADQVVALLNVGQFRPRQLIVTKDGEIFGGRLAQQSLAFTLTSGQAISIPLDQITRMGYRKRPDEPRQWTFNKPMVLMRGGDRVEVRPPNEKIPILSRYGLLSLDPSVIAAIAFQTGGGGVHEIYLTDGSKFAGLVAADDLDMTLDGVGPDQAVQFPVSGMLRLQLTAKTPDPDPDRPSLLLLNQDVLCGALAGQLHLQTAFDTLTLDGEQISQIVRQKGNSTSDGNVRVTLWDGSNISGQIVEPVLACRLLSGPTLSVPTALLQEYDQPHPYPAAGMVKQIQAIAAQLSSDDWRQRDQAQGALEAMGTGVIGVLRDLRPKATPEGQQRIDAIIKKLESSTSSDTPDVQPGGPMMMTPGLGGVRFGT